MLPAHYLVRYTLAALGGPSIQNGEDLLFAANGRLLEIEGYLSNEPGREGVKDRDPGPFVPADMLPQRKKQPPPRPDFPEERFFYDLIVFIDHLLIPPVAEIGELFDPIGREPRIMRALNDVRRQINIAVVEIVGTALPHASESELLDRINSVMAKLSIPASDAPIIPAYKRLSLETKHIILSFCTSFLDLQNLLYTTRWGPAAAFKLDRLQFSNPAARLGAIPSRLSEAWPVFNMCPNLRHISIDTPFANSAAPRRPAWALLSGEVDMTARQLWSDFAFWRMLGILGEPLIPEFTVIHPSEAVARHFCWETKDQAVSIALLRREREDEEGYEIVIERASGRVRVLRDFAPAFDAYVFDVLALRSVTRLVLPDKIRSPALWALFNAELTHVEELEVILDEKSDEPLPFRQEPTRLLQQQLRTFRRTFNCPSVQRLTISAPRPMRFNYSVILSFRALLSGRRPSIEGVNVHFS